MKDSKIIATSTMACVISLLCASGTVYAAPPDGMYVGTTDQGRDFELRVTGGRVDQWYINVLVSCVYGSSSGGVRTTISPSCVIEGDGSFVCGSVNCPATFFSSEVGGMFDPDDTVTGTIEVAARFGSNCCYLTTAFEAALFVEELFADGFESGDCTAWSQEVP
jgi:hypothetical protein